MKALALWLAVFVIFGVTAAAVAQSPTQPSMAPSTSAPADKQPSMAPSTPAPSASPKADVDVKADVKTDSSRPARSPDVNVNIDKRDRAADSRQDDGAAFPRGAGGERTTIFGMSPTAAVVIAAALLVVVILAIVAMTRSGESTTYIDRDRRL